MFSLIIIVAQRHFRIVSDWFKVANSTFYWIIQTKFESNYIAVPLCDWLRVKTCKALKLTGSRPYQVYQ